VELCKALAGFKKVLGNDHPSTVLARKNLAEVQAKQKK
jgi:hypothetical protein